MILLLSLIIIIVFCSIYRDSNCNLDDTNEDDFFIDDDFKEDDDEDWE